MREAEFDDERAWPRARRDGVAACLSFKGYVAASAAAAVASGMGSYLVDGVHGWWAALVTVGAALGGALAVVLLAFGVSLVMAPIRQRDEAREALGDLQQRRSAPLVIKFVFSPEPPLVLAMAGTAQATLVVDIENQHADDIANVVLNLDVPSTIRLTRVNSDGGSYNGPGRLIPHGNRAYWQEMGRTLHGGGWHNRFTFVVICTQPGRHDLAAKLRVPGFDSLAERFALDTVTP